LRNDDRALPGRADQHAPAGALGLFREIVEHGGGADHLADCLDQRLALFLGEQAADRLGAFAQQGGGLVEDLATLFDIEGAPFGPCAIGRRQRLVEVGGAGQRQLGDGLARGRVDHGRGVALACTPCAVDEELQLGFISHALQLGAPAADGKRQQDQRQQHGDKADHGERD
jgi:hypothetical protein